MSTSDPSSAAGEPTTHLPPPFINLASVANLRDTGSYPIPGRGSRSSARSVRRQTLYRSADPSRISAADLATLERTHGIRTVIDLRSEPELSRGGTTTAAAAAAAGSDAPAAAVLRRVRAPVFAAADYGPDAVAARFADYAADGQGAAGFVRAYAQILRHAGPALAAVLRALADERAGAVLVHCSAGKDRTGCVVAVVLSLLGVEDEVVAEEYALSEVGLADLKAGFVDRLIASGVFEDNAEGRKRAERMVGSKAEAMRGTLQWLKEEYGGAEEYVRKVVGFGEDVVESVRARLIVEAEKI